MGVCEYGLNVIKENFAINFFMVHCSHTNV